MPVLNNAKCKHEFAMKCYCKICKICTPDVADSRTAVQDKSWPLVRRPGVAVLLRISRVALLHRNRRSVSTVESKKMGLAKYVQRRCLSGSAGRVLSEQEQA